MTSTFTTFDFVGCVAYSVYEDQPIALIWKHCYTSLTTRASSDFYTELVVRKESDEESNIEAISRVLSHIRNGDLNKPSNKMNKKKKPKTKSRIVKSNHNMNGDWNEAQSSARFLLSLKRFEGVAILENANGYRVYLIPVKYIKTKKLHKSIQSSLFYNDCHWVLFSELFSSIYEFEDISKMTIFNFENSKKKQKQKQKYKKYPLCRLSLQFSAMLRNSQHRVILPLFEEMRLHCNVDNDNNNNNNSDSKTDEVLMPTANELVDAYIEIKQPNFSLKCKKCRHLLFTDLDMKVHSQQSINSQCCMQLNVCNCIFLDGENANVLKLISEMSDTSQMNGIMYCVKCRVKIGRFNYFGSQCSCNAWICPAYQISVSKVDIQRLNQEFAHTNTVKYFEGIRSGGADIDVSENNNTEVDID